MCPAQCVCSGVHTSQDRLRGRAALPPALLITERSQGYELVPTELPSE